jgi:hypothetical protein
VTGELVRRQCQRGDFAEAQHLLMQQKAGGRGDTPLYP